LGRFNKQFLFQLIFLSFLRYVIFLLQYFLLFALFNVDVSVVVIASVMSVVFLAMSVIPSIALVEIGLRGEVSLKLMGIFSANSLGIGLTTVSVWFMNLIIPAILGSLLLLNIKLIRKNEAG
jgi:ABC-type transport system involved in cytochrome c biogenesis permease subunit